MNLKHEIFLFLVAFCPFTIDIHSKLSHVFCTPILCNDVFNNVAEYAIKGVISLIITLATRAILNRKQKQNEKEISNKEKDSNEKS